MKITAVTSSSIQSIGYSKETKTLQVTFLTGGVYQYYAVPQSAADEFIFHPISGSYGKHLNEKIKGFYRYNKV